VSIAVVTRRLARPGLGAQLVAALVALPDATSHGGWQQARVFQDIDRPDIVLLLHYWATEADYAAHARQWSPPALDELCVAPALRRVYHRLAAYRTPGAPPAHVMSYLQHRFPAAARGAVLQFLRDVAGPAVQAQPGLVSRELYAALDEDDRIFALHGWASRAAWDHWLEESAPLLRPGLQELGCTIRRFILRTRGELERATTSPL
jgi:heme-degrading monooxygenase HmoA